MHKKDMGVLGQISVQKDLIRRGYQVFAEQSDNSRVDLIAYNETTKVAHRIQVKTASIKRGGVITLPLRKTGPNGYSYNYTTDDFDVYALYVPEIDTVAYITNTLGSMTELTFRTTEPKGKCHRATRLLNEHLDFPIAKGLR